MMITIDQIDIPISKNKKKQGQPGNCSKQIARLEITDQNLRSALDHQKSEQALNRSSHRLNWLCGAWHWLTRSINHKEPKG